MWRISYKTMFLREVLITAYMNVLEARSCAQRPGHRLECLLGDDPTVFWCPDATDIRHSHHRTI